MQISDEILSLSGLHNDVVDVGIDVAPHLGPQAGPHGSLESCTGVLQSEGHAGETKASFRCEESCFFLILLGHLNLVVPRESVQKAEEVTPCGGVHYLVDPRVRIWILGVGLVEVHEVDAASLPAIVLGHNDRIGEPVSMDDLADDSRLK